MEFLFKKNRGNLKRGVCIFKLTSLVGQYRQMVSSTVLSLSLRTPTGWDLNYWNKEL